MILNKYFSNSKNIVRHFIFLIVIIIIVLAGSLIYTKKSQINKSTTDKFVDHDTDVLDEFYYPYGSFKMDIADGWLKKTDFELADPVVGTIIKKEDVEFAFEKKSESCALVYGLVTGEYGKQTSFGNRVFTKDEEQIDSSWYVREEYRPEGLNFIWTGEQPIPYETRIMGYPSAQSSGPGSYFGFILYATDKGDVSRENCDKDVSDMLSSIQMKFLPIDTNSDGIFFIFSELNDLSSKRIMMISENSRESFFSDSFKILFIDPILQEDNLFYVSDTGSLFSLNIKSFESKELITMNPEEAVINGFTILDNVVYYLAGKQCNEYLAKCNNALYEFNLDSGITTKLYEGSKSRKILGKNPATNKIYLAWLDGDAGCVWGSVEEFDFQTKQITPIEIFKSTCVEDGDYKELMNNYNNFLDTLVPKLKTADYFKIKNNQITISKDYINTIYNREYFYISVDPESVE